MVQRCILSAVVAAAIPAAAAAQRIPGDAVFVASSQGQVYYWSGCTAWRDLARANLRFFTSRAEAVAAGYRLSAVTECAGPPVGEDAGPGDDGSQPPPGPAPSTNEPLVARVVDVGPGLCTVTTIPAADRPHFVVYDAGHWTGRRCVDAVREVVGAHSIDLLVVSHSDSDHLGDADRILNEFVVESAVTTGFERSTASWRRMHDALNAAEAGGTAVRRLTTDPLTPGESVTVGDATVTFVAGWGSWSLTTGLTAAERRNVISIVIRIDYGGGSVLYAGDTVGKRLTDPDSACKDAEMVMVGRHTSSMVSLDADVLIAAHHGGNNGSSSCFVEAVSPSAVVFSAGHDHAHPTDPTAQRLISAGVSPDSIFRTDRGDDEPESHHWEPAGTVAGCTDPRGDDDIEIRISAMGRATVAYLTPAGGCQ